MWPGNQQAMPGKDGAVIEKSDATFIFKDEPGRELPAYDFAEKTR